MDPGLRRDDGEGRRSIRISFRQNRQPFTLHCPIKLAITYFMTPRRPPVKQAQPHCWRNNPFKAVLKVMLWT